MDGKDADRISVCQKVGTSMGKTYQGYKVGMNANESKYRAFTFGKMDLTSEFKTVQLTDDDSKALI